MIKLTELALNNGAIVMDELMPSQTEIVFNTSQLQAFADEYLALSSSEPVGVIKEELRREDGAVMHYAHLYSHLPLDSQLFLANPINQQLLTERNELQTQLQYWKDFSVKVQKLADSKEVERNECVEEIRRLKGALNAVANIYANKREGIIGMAWLDEVRNCLVSPASIQKLLNTSLDNK
jgi:predicted DNA-binding protein YlxM (UPF0122 family)